MIASVKRRELEELVPLLEAEDAFTRLDAEKRLRDLARRDFGFRWGDPPEARASAITRLKEWMERARRAERTLRKAAAAAAAGGLAQVNLAELKGLSPQDLEKHLQVLLSKAQFVPGSGRPRCEACAERPATVEIVEVSGGRKARAVTLLCDACAAERGEIRGAE